MIGRELLWSRSEPVSSGKGVQTTGANLSSGWRKIRYLKLSCRKSEVMLTCTCIGLGFDWCVFILFTIVLSWRINPQLQLSSTLCSSLSHNHLPQIYLHKVSPLIHKDFSSTFFCSTHRSHLQHLSHIVSLTFSRSSLPSSSPSQPSSTSVSPQRQFTFSSGFLFNIILDDPIFSSIRTLSVFLSLVPFLLFRLQSFFCILRRSECCYRRYSQIKLFGSNWWKVRYK